jgi:RimJ/RimL family protein N-acetyltransferase
VDGVVEIAYFTFPDFEGQGYATAMAAELVDRAAQAADGRGVRAHMLPVKSASTLVLEKTEFHVVGHRHRSR